MSKITNKLFSALYNSFVNKEKRTIEWWDTVRGVEAEELLKEMNGKRFHRCLEIGCGNLKQSVSLKKLSDRYVGIDLRYQDEAGTLVVADAQSLPFKDDTFDLIISSNAIEHIPDKKALVSELKRVSTPDSTQIHIVPTAFWVSLRILSYVPYQIMYKLSKGLAIISFKFIRREEGVENGMDKKSHAQGTEQYIAVQSKSSVWRRFWEIICIAPHGTAKDTFEEWSEFRVSRWKLFFESHFNVVFDRPLMAYSPFAFMVNRFMGFRHVLGKMGLSGSHLFIMKNKSSENR